VDQYVLEQAVSKLQPCSRPGLNVSSPPTLAFEFQDFSRVFLTSSNDPITIFNRNQLRVLEHSDPFNLDRKRRGRGLLPSLASLGYTPAGRHRRPGALSHRGHGPSRRRAHGPAAQRRPSFIDDPIDIMSANSVVNVPTAGVNYAIDTSDRALSDAFDSGVDTNFFLGRQNAFQLLDKFITP
jgi:hypothetical protein